MYNVHLHEYVSSTCGFFFHTVSRYYIKQCGGCTDALFSVCVALLVVGWCAVGRAS